MLSFLNFNNNEFKPCQYTTTMSDDGEIIFDIFFYTIMFSMMIIIFIILYIILCHMNYMINSNKRLINIIDIILNLNFSNKISKEHTHNENKIYKIYRKRDGRLIKTIFLFLNENNLEELKTILRNTKEFLEEPNHKFKKKHLNKNQIKLMCPSYPGIKHQIRIIRIPEIIAIVRENYNDFYDYEFLDICVNQKNEIHLFAGIEDENKNEYNHLNNFKEVRCNNIQIPIQ